MKQKRVVCVHISDIHSGHQLGLLQPDTEIQVQSPDGSFYYYTPNLTKSQEYLQELYLKSIDDINAFAGKDPVIVFMTGDITHGNKHIQQCITADVSSQITIAVANMRPLYRLRTLKAVRFAGGTGSHTFEGASGEMLVASNLRLEYPRVDTKTVFHGSYLINGAEIDYAHHGPYPGSREWLRGNVARFYLRDMMMRHAMEGSLIPSIVLRGHYHSFVKEYLSHGGFGAWLVVAPSMCLLDDYARYATRSEFKCTNGMVVFDIVGSKVGEPALLGNTIDVRTKEVIEL